MIHALLIPYMAITARQAGGGLGAHKLWKPLPEILFALPFGYLGFLLLGYYGLPYAVLAYLAMQTGHGTVLHWGDDYKQSFGRTQTLTPVVNRLAKLLDIDKGSKNYCRLFMAVKGFAIFPPLVIFWPLAYEIGHSIKRHEWSELLSGAFAGVCLFVTIAMVQ